MDLASGYWQVKMSPNSIEKTAFATREGLYQFCRLPFGLKNAPSSFSRLMSTVLQGLNLKSCMVYIDDILIWSKGGVREHLARLGEVSERLRAAGLSCKMSKCRLFETSVEYLGHIITREGVMTDPAKVEVIKQLPQPSTLTEIRAFLGATGYYRRAQAV